MMNCNARRVVRSRCSSTFAILLSAIANLAYAASPDLSFSPASLNFKYQAGSALPAAQTLQVKSTGAALAFTVSITGPLPYSAQWLSVSSNSGTTSLSLKVYVNPTGLPSGSYSGTIVVNAPSATTVVQNYPVTLDVGDAPASLMASTGALTFAYTTGTSAPPSQAVVLMSTGGALTAAIAITGGTWLKASPNGSIALVGLPSTVTVSVDPTGLSPAIYSGKIVFSSATSANKTTTVNITLTVTAGVPTVAANGVWPPGALVGSPAMIVTLTGTNFFPTSTAAIGVTTLVSSVLSPTTMLGTIPANLMASAGALSLIVTTQTAASPSTPATFTVYGPGPQISAVAEAASYNTSTVSPGGIVTIYGINLGPASLVTFPGTNPIPVSLPVSGAATSITIDGTPAPILYTSATQVSCIVPFALSAKSGTTVKLIVTYNSIASAGFDVNVVDADPGIFTIDASGTGQGAVLNFNAITGDYVVNSSATAATKGSTVSIYITGVGLTSCVDTVASKCIVNANEMDLVAGTVTPTGAVSVTIDGQTATVLGAVAPIGSVPGVLQINASVPTTVKAGNSVPLVVAIGAAKSQSRVIMCVK